MQKVLPSSTLYWNTFTKHCTKLLQILLCTTKLACCTSYKACTKRFPVHGNHLYYKGCTCCTKHFPVLFCTTTCTIHFPVLHRTTKLASSTSQHYFVLQRLHKTRPSTRTTNLHKVQLSTILYYKLAQLISQHKLCCTKYFCTRTLLHWFYIEIKKLLRREAFTRRSFYTEKLLHREASTRGSFYTEKLIYTQKLHEKASAQRSVCTEKFLHREAFTQRTEPCTQRSLCARQAFTHKSFHMQNPATEIAADIGAKEQKPKSTF